MKEQEFENMKKLGLKIEQLSGLIGKIAKDGRNDHQSFDFVSNEAMTTALRAHLAEEMLSIAPNVVDFSERDFIVDLDNGKQKVTIRTTVKMEFEITDLETGFTKTMFFAGAENDTAGKSFQQAITQCTKYFYFKLFKVTSKDESDPDSNDGTVNRPASTSSASVSSDLTPDGNPKKWLNQKTKEWTNAVQAVADGKPVNAVRDYYKISKTNAEALEAEAKALKESSK